MPLCIGTSLAIIIPTSIRSFRAHHARGAVDMEILKHVVAADPDRRDRRQRHRALRAGAAVQDRVRGGGVVGGGAAAAGARDWKFGDDVPKGPLMKLYGFIVGLLSTLMGVGGGLFSNLLMTFYGRPIHQAVATSSALAVLISIPGAIGYVYAGWPAAARLSRRRRAAIAVRARLRLADRRRAGDADQPADRAARRRAAHAMSKRTLEMAFGCYLFIVGSRFVVSLL